MIDPRSLKYDGRQRNHLNGLTFYFTRQGHVLIFLIDVIGDKKRKIKVTIHPDINHGRAHVHIDEHGASFAVDNGELLAGNCDANTRKLMENWIARHRGDLLQLWDIIKRGGEYQPAVERIRHKKTFDDFGFRGDEPRYKSVIDGVIVWHNENLLVERDEEGKVLAMGEGDLYVVIPEDYPDGHITIVPLEGDLQVRRLAHTA